MEINKYTASNTHLVRALEKTYRGSGENLSDYRERDRNSSHYPPTQTPQPVEYPRGPSKHHLGNIIDTYL